MAVWFYTGFDDCVKYRMQNKTTQKQNNVTQTRMDNFNVTPSLLPCWFQHLRWSVSCHRLQSPGNHDWGSAHPAGKPVRQFFIRDGCRRAQPTTGGATPSQVVLGCIRRQAEQAVGSQPVHCSMSLLQLPSWLLSTMHYALQAEINPSFILVLTRF